MITRYREQNESDARTLGELAQDLSTEVKHLLNQELQLAKTEMRQIARRLAIDSAMLIAGVVVAFFAVMALCLAVAAAIAVALAQAISYGYAAWLGPLIAALALGAVAAFMILTGWQRLKKAKLQPKQTEQSLREDARWLKKQFQ